MENDVYGRSLALHEDLRGKLEVRSEIQVKGRQALPLA